MKSFNVKSHLNFNAQKKFVPCLNESWQELAVIDFDEVYEGYKISCKKIESKNTDGLVYYEASSNVNSSPNVFKTLDEMCEYIDDWKNELINNQ
jgi:hypothetical protein